ncbi:MAG TPA: DNA polymerase II [Candidatus Nanoarchaeia archaeon]|nr:DNA polymerase II [Candidatus Nanoarchaeia archaeon]
MPAQKGFIVYAAHTATETETSVYLYGRLENGDSFVTISTIEPYFYLGEKDVEKNVHYLTKYKVEKTKLATFDKQEVVKVSHSSYIELIKLVSFLHEKKINTYEADLKPHTRFLVDNDFKGTISITGDYEKAERLDRIYRQPELKPSEGKIKLRTLSLDIESDKKLDRLFCIGLYSEKYRQAFIVSKKKLAHATSCADEAECLRKVRDKIIEIDPDIITGWNLPDFDFPYLKKKYAEHEMPFDIGRDNSQIKMRQGADFFKKSTVTIAGRQVLDGLSMIKDPFIKEAPTIKNINIESWTLEDVSQAILGEGKLISGSNRHEQIESWFNGGNHQELVDYNLQDCKLAYDLLQKTKTLELAMERSELTGITLDKITGSVVAFDSLYIREATKRGLVSPTTRYSHKEESIKGGYVMDSNPGIYHNVLVLDFKSLYPSLIRTYNIDPASYLKNPAKEKTVKAPNGAHFRNEDGILPSIIAKLHEAREKAKKENREFASYAIKIIMNSFFGVLANANCRYFSLDVANAITHFAQATIKLTAQKVHEKGYEVIYSDTDSVFINTKLENKDKARKVGEELTEYINKFYTGYIKETYKRHSFLEIELKRHYLSFMIPPLRATEKGSKKGSKKRYAGLIEEKGKEQLEIVGLEAIRGDWTDAAQEFQKQLLFNIFHRKEFVKFIKEFVSDLKAGRMDKKLVYRKSIRKSLEEYTKTTPPHVKAARKLDKLEGSIIEYYITEDGPEPLQKLKHKIDYEHYINKQIAPIANTLLFFFHRNFEDILKESKQTRLFA